MVCAEAPAEGADGSADADEGVLLPPAVSASRTPTGASAAGESRPGCEGGR